MRAFAGATIGAVVSFGLLVFAVVIWGGFYGGLPCYGGASRYSATELFLAKALFSILDFPVLPTLFVVPAGVILGVISSWLMPGGKSVRSPERR